MTKAKLRNPHLRTAPTRMGTDPADCRRAAVVLHGRSLDPAYMKDNLIIRLTSDSVAYLLPAAHDRSWYPEPFSAAVAENEPWFGHALDAVDACLDDLEEAGVPAQQIVLIGFSQGACLAAELIARRPRPLGGAALLTASLLGPDDAPTSPLTAGPRPPIMLTGGTEDSWIPLDRIVQTAIAFAESGVEVTFRSHHDEEHHIRDADVEIVQSLLDRP